ncbi:MAG: Ada metal-binding domain-containing protein [Paracoccaceae bacterium]
MTDQDWADLVARRARPGVVGVVSTGIFCGYGCPARTPLRHNVRLFDSHAAAMAAGLRACKRCGGHPKTDQPVARARRSIASAPNLELP